MERKNEPELNKSNVFSHKQISALASKDRKTLQNPEEILRYLELKPSYVVADLGCGSGYFAVPISRKVKKVYALDIQEERLDYLKQKIQENQIGNIEPLLNNDNNIPLQDESIDMLLSVNTLHEFRDKESIIKEMQRVLKQDGRAIIVDFKKETTDFGPPESIRVSKEQAIILFREHKLTALKTHDLKYHYLLVLQKK